jgi:hypothetical protein
MNNNNNNNNNNKQKSKGVPCLPWNIQFKYLSIDTLRFMPVTHSPADATAGLYFVGVCRQLQHVTSIHIPSAACFTVCLSFFTGSTEIERPVFIAWEFHTLCDVPETINNECVAINSNNFPSSYFSILDFIKKSGNQPRLRKISLFKFNFLFCSFLIISTSSQYTRIIFFVWFSVHHKSIYIKNQRDATWQYVY